MNPLVIEIIRGIISLVAIVAGSFVALRMYFKQKEYELVKQRYLESAVDAVASHLEDSLGVVSHNYARCLQIVKSFRDAESNFDLKELDRGFLELDSSRFHQIAHLRLEVLIGSKVLWSAYQHALAFCTSTNSRIVKEIPEAMRLRHTTSLINRSFAEMGDTMVNDLRSLHDEGFKFAGLISELHFLSRLLELERLNLKAVARLHERSEIRQLVARLTESFPESPEASIDR